MDGDVKDRVFDGCKRTEMEELQSMRVILTAYVSLALEMWNVLYRLQI